MDKTRITKANKQHARRSAGAGEIKEINMIEIRYLQAESGANKFGTCNCCGKSSSEDPLMISIKFSYYGHGTAICLCDDCKKKLMEALPPANNSEIPNSSDTISRQVAIEALYHVDEYNGRSVEAIRKLPPAQPEIIRCRNCKFASGDSRICMKFGHSPIGELDFCAWAERGTDE